MIRYRVFVRFTLDAGRARMRAYFVMAADQGEAHTRMAVYLARTRLDRRGEYHGHVVATEAV